MLHTHTSPCRRSEPPVTTSLRTTRTIRAAIRRWRPTPPSTSIAPPTTVPASNHRRTLWAGRSGLSDRFRGVRRRLRPTITHSCHLKLTNPPRPTTIIGDHSRIAHTLTHPAYTLNSTVNSHILHTTLSHDTRTMYTICSRMPGKWTTEATRAPPPQLRINPFISNAWRDVSRGGRCNQLNNPEDFY